jgi:hypothetical protein
MNNGTRPKVIRLPPTAIQEAHDLTPTCNAARDAHWTAHSLACRANRDLVNVQRKAAR